MELSIIILRFPSASRFLYFASSLSETFSRDSVGSSSDSSRSSRSSYASSSGSFPSIASTISSTFSDRSTPLPEFPTSSLPSPQDKAIKNVSNVTYFESKSSGEPLYHQIPTRQKLLTVIPTARNRPSALARLQDVENVFCVAFGIFDRYYIAWEDTQGEQHQESNKLPQLLYNWLYPESGQTRHLPSLQVSFGTNNEFFASDKDDKISSRDSVPSAISHASRLSLTKPIVRTKSQPILNLYEVGEDAATISRTSRFKRRSTMFTSDYQTYNPTRNTIERRETLEELSSQPSIAETPLAAYIINNDTESRRIGLEHRIPSSLSRRRSDLSRIRDSWSEQPAQGSNILKREMYNSERKYIDNCIQTDICRHHLDEILSTGVAPPILPQELQYQSVQTMPFGSMQDYFRGQYNLGDALYYG
ncbi:uncharacterized protein Bfra_011236 [Botrytis fragariae]|uniref:Uncharacterized protein n=1 Tax=Botrytis fragariae TaxID=1964551 RepID=A0A8H6EEY9_9HELO|nr:uncharacterized protein Bfra_011236 [Botrytis fragariae]KAF5869430.1 hypothetical protein Bfra_011236 [Botrytis fragariae]